MDGAVYVAGRDLDRRRIVVGKTNIGY